MYKLLVRAMLCIYLVVLRFLCFVGVKKRRFHGGKFTVMLTATFYSKNWLAPHIRPIGLSQRCDRVIVVATNEVPICENVEAIYPSKWLVRFVGKVPARLFTFFKVGLFERPHVVGGFHLLLNGLAACFLAKIIGAYSLYICGGGPREVEGGGYATENRIFRKLGVPDKVVERQLLKAVSKIDIVVTMGTTAIEYFQKKGIVTPTYHAVPGGFNGKHFFPKNVDVKYDIIFVGRLSSVKQVDVLLEAINLVKKEMVGIKVAIIGDGPLRDELESYSATLNLSDHVDFLGKKNDVAELLQKSKIFILTSSSEGLSLAMIEAMLCGVPPVVSDVGDLSDLVEHGINGYLVSPCTAELFYHYLFKILSNNDELELFRTAARQSAEKYLMEKTAEKWDNIFELLS